MEKVIINFEIEKDSEIYKILNYLIVNFPEIRNLTISYKGKVWVFENPEKVKYFLKDKYFDFEEKKEIKVKNL